MAIINVEIKDAIERLLDGRKAVTFLLAVSGGPDSQVLLKAFPHVCEALEKKHNVHLKCVAAGINHGLRPEADAELDLAEKTAEDMLFIRSRVHIDGSSNIQCKARDARYSRLIEIADANECDYVVTAHHFDDKAETVFIRLLRGDGVGSLAVLPEVSGRIFRPLLNVTREDIMGYIKRWSIPYAMDPSNANLHYLRSQIRHDILPMLEMINPRFKTRLVNLANEIMAGESTCND